MSNKNKSLDSASKINDSVWKKAFSSNAEWPDKVRCDHGICEL